MNKNEKNLSRRETLKMALKLGGLALGILAACKSGS